MLDLGWSEIAVIAVLALVVIGPKDLPKVLRTVGKWVRKIRAIGGEFQKHMDDVMRETGADEVRKQVNTLARTDLGGKIDKAIDPDGSLTKALKDKPGEAKAAPTDPTGDGEGGKAPEPAPPLEQTRRETTPLEGVSDGDAAQKAPEGVSGGDAARKAKAASAEQQQ